MSPPSAVEPVERKRGKKGLCLVPADRSIGRGFKARQTVGNVGDG